METITVTMPKSVWSDMLDWAERGVEDVHYLIEDAGTLRVPARFRGPFSWARCDASHGRAKAEDDHGPGCDGPYNCTCG